MNTVLLNTISLDGETVIKKGSGGGGGGIPINNQSKSVEFTENGTSEVRYDAGYTGLEKVSVKVAIPTESKSVTITENGSSEVSASKGYLDKVSIKVAIPTEEKAIDITENGTTEVVAANGFLSKVVVNTNVASSGGGNTPAPSKGAVNFIDYDGTILHSYAKDEFLALTEMPALPTQKGLTCQGWNWSLGDAKAYVEQYGTIDVGATYITDDGKTRLYITIVAEGRMEVPLALKQSVANGVVIDWGDGSATETFSGTSATLKHTYGKIGDYVISLEVVSGTFSLVGSSSGGIFGGPIKAYANMLQKVELGDSITSIGNYAFFECYSLSSVVIPNSVTSIESSAFRLCPSLSSVVMPNSVTSIGASTFYQCCSLSSVVIPNSVASIGLEVFYQCYSLSSVVIPNGITSIGNQSFYQCYSLSSVVIPNGITSIGNQSFYQCYSLSSVVIPNSVTSISKNLFYQCYSLSSVVIPNSVTSIDNYALYGCSSVVFYDFRTHTSVPILSNTNALSTASDCKIVVPDALYDEWIAATNWSSKASYIIKASEFNG